MNHSDVFANRAECFRFNFKTESRCKAHRAQHAQLVFFETSPWFSNRANDSRLQIRAAADEIENFAGVVPHQKSVDRKIPPLHILFGGFGVNHSVWMPAVGITR